MANQYKKSITKGTNKSLQITEERVREIAREEIERWNSKRVINIPGKIELEGINHQ